ncbi:MAG: D-sedoheptulose 7-phosphate isomerase [Proteobacteria bacterium]|nr:D-sedoheptulose 7-phosphate isomerase [Pseudomonadota bacterium]
MKNFEELIIRRGHDSAALCESFCTTRAAALNLTANSLLDAIKGGGKILAAGNGGSAADAQHFAAELVNRFLMERHPLPAIALTTDTSVLTSIANDYSFDLVFSRQIEALGREGDVLLALSTSGTSENILKALDRANSKGLTTIGLTGGNAARMAALCDICLSVPDTNTPRVQEVHHLVLHILCEMVEIGLFSHGT